MQLMPGFSGGKLVKFALEHLTKRPKIGDVPEISTVISQLQNLFKVYVIVAFQQLQRLTVWC